MRVMDLGTLGDLLRDCREGRALRAGEGKLSLSALSARTATDGFKPIDINAISAIERGRKPNTGLQTVVRLIEAMKLRPSVFFRYLEGGGALPAAPPVSLLNLSDPQAVPSESPAAPLPETVPVPRKTYDQLLEWFVLSVEENQRKPGANRRHAANARNVRVGSADSAARRRDPDQHPARQTRSKPHKRTAKQRKR